MAAERKDVVVGQERAVIDPARRRLCAVHDNDAIPIPARLRIVRGRARDERVVFYQVVPNVPKNTAGESNEHVVGNGERGVVIVVQGDASREVLKPIPSDGAAGLGD